MSLGMEIGLGPGDIVLDGGPEVLRDIAMATIFSLSIYMASFLYMAAHCRHPANPTEVSVCSCDAALCQITLTTC